MILNTFSFVSGTKGRIQILKPLQGPAVPDLERESHGKRGEAPLLFSDIEKPALTSSPPQR